MCAIILLCILYCGSFGQHFSKDNITFVVNSTSADWWEHAVIYQIYTRSFMDQNNDGIGDLQGIITKLQYLNDTGFNILHISSIFNDDLSINSDYGVVEDLKILVDKAHMLNLKVILDFVPNYISSKHKWFINSVAKIPPFTDFFVWSEGKKYKNGSIGPPNNWLSLIKGSAWTWNKKRRQYYFHQFSAMQPDLNYRNENVTTRMKNNLIYWLHLGVDGFRIDTLPYLFEDAQLRNEPKSGLIGVSKSNYEYLHHIYTSNLNETFHLLYEWRKLLDNYTTSHGGSSRILVTEVYGPINDVIRYYGTPDAQSLGAHFSFNFDLLTRLTFKNITENLLEIIRDWNENLPMIYTYNWVLGNDHVSRLVSRLGKELASGLTMFVMLLPGVMITYNGEEIGMENGQISCKEGKDRTDINNCTLYEGISRDFQRTPFQWDNTTNAGFNAGTKPWLPINRNANQTNLKNEKLDEKSYYNLFRKMLQLRKDLYNHKELKKIVVQQIEENTLQLYHGSESFFYILLWNLGEKSNNVSIGNGSADLPYKVVISGLNSNKPIGGLVNSNFTLHPKEIIVVMPIQLGDDNDTSTAGFSIKVIEKVQLIIIFVLFCNFIFM